MQTATAGRLRCFGFIYFIVIGFYRIRLPAKIRSLWCYFKLGIMLKWFYEILTILYLFLLRIVAFILLYCLFYLNYMQYASHKLIVSTNQIIHFALKI